MPGSASIRDAIGMRTSVLPDVFEHAGFWTIASVREADLDDVTDSGIMKKLNAAMREIKESDWRTIKDWDRIARGVYNCILQIHAARVIDDIRDIPPFFRCGISMDWMTNPVITPDGHCYDRVHIMRWLLLDPRDPLSRRPLTADELVPNRALQAAIAHYRPLEARYVIPPLER